MGPEADLSASPKHCSIKCIIRLTLQNKHGTAGKTAELHKFVRQIAFKIFRICFDQASGTFADPIATGHGPLGAAGPEAAASLASIMIRLCVKLDKMIGLSGSEEFLRCVKHAISTH